MATRQRVKKRVIKKKEVRRRGSIWRGFLQEPPYAVTIGEETNAILFKESIAHDFRLQNRSKYT